MTFCSGELRVKQKSISELLNFWLTENRTQAARMRETRSARARKASKNSPVQHIHHMISLGCIKTAYQPSLRPRALHENEKGEKI